MVRTVRIPRSPAGPPPTRRSHAGRLAAAAIGVASATSLGVGLGHSQRLIAPVSAATPLLPDDSLTPGATDPNVHGTEICTNTWKPGPNGEPPVQGGNLTYSKAARHTSAETKDEAFREYDISNPHDGGRSYEVDHRIPLALGGRDLLTNLWPQSRTAPGWNAWVKDRLEFRLYNLLCHPKPGDPPVTLAEVQVALKGDWTKAYEMYCSNEDDCAASGDQTD